MVGVGDLHLVKSGVHGGGEDEAAGLEGGSHLGDQDAEVLPVLNAGSLEEGGVLPIEVDTSEAELIAELDAGVDEDAPLGGVGGHLGEGGGSGGPSSDGDHGHEVGVDLLESNKPPESVQIAAVGVIGAVLLGEVQPHVPGLDLEGLVVDVSEAVEAVCAEVGVNVLDLEGARLQPLIRKQF